MKLVFLAMMAATGVFFGVLALVVDLGYGMGQQGYMQNAADAGALAAAKHMADSVAVNASNQTVIGVSDDAVNGVANTFANYNHANTGTAVEYLNWTTTCDSFNPREFSYASDSSLVPAGAIRVATTLPASQSLGSIPNNTCGVRVFAGVSYGAFFAAANGVQTEGATASSAARIAPTSAPQVFSDVWPITHYEDPSNPDPACAFEIGGCSLPFWSSHGTGSFKYLVDMSKRSAINNSRDQLFAPDLSANPLLSKDCSMLAQFDFKPCYDPVHNGTNDKTNDMPYWLAHGWNGQIYVPNETDPRCTTNNRVINECPNSRFEMFNGDLGNNASNSMYDPNNLDGYLNLHPDAGLDPTCNCTSTTVNVFFWRYGEQAINSTSNVGSVWDNGQSNSLQRIVVDKVRRFRFNTSTIDSSKVSGYFVSFYNPDGTPGSGPPSNVANTVILIN